LPSSTIGHPLDAVRLEQFGNLGNGHVGRRSDHVAGHDVAHLTGMLLDELRGGRVGIGEQRQPPGAPPAGARFGAMHQVAFADDAEQAARRVDDRQGADAVLEQQIRHVADAGVLGDGDDLGGHDVSCLHDCRLLRSDAGSNGEPWTLTVGAGVDADQTSSSTLAGGC
jgi:hypothetical protein